MGLGEGRQFERQQALSVGQSGRLEVGDGELGVVERDAVGKERIDVALTREERVGDDDEVLARVDAVEVAEATMVTMTAVRRPPESSPVKSQFFPVTEWSFLPIPTVNREKGRGYPPEGGALYISHRSP